MAGLEKGLTYEFTVIKKENVDSFNSRATGALKYCHIFLLEDSTGAERECQICSDYPDCDPNLIPGRQLTATVKNFSKGVYTIDSVILKISKDEVVKPTPAMPSPVVVTQKNPMVAGSLADRALAQAVTWHSHVGFCSPLLDDSDGVDLLFKTADRFHEWLSNKIS